MIHVNLDEIVDAIESIEDEETAYLDPQTGKIQYTGSDDENMDVMFSESFDDSGIGQAIMNRLLKAAGHNVIRL